MPEVSTQPQTISDQKSLNWKNIIIGIIIGAILVGLGALIFLILQSEPEVTPVVTTKKAMPSAKISTPSTKKDETADWEVFSDKILDFSLRLPNGWYIEGAKSWSKESWSDGDSRTSIYNYDPETSPPRGYKPELDKGKIKIEVIKKNKSQDQSLKAFVDKIDFQPAEVKNKTNLNVDGKEAIKVEYELNSLQAGVYVEKDVNTVYTINLFLDYEGNKELFNQVLSTFKFLN